MEYQKKCIENLRRINGDRRFCLKFKGKTNEKNQLPWKSVIKNPENSKVLQGKNIILFRIKRKKWTSQTTLTKNLLTMTKLGNEKNSRGIAIDCYKKWNIIVEPWYYVIN
jgi:hypothetical protein